MNGDIDIFKRPVDEECDRFVGKYGDTLYHYTSISTLVGILEKGELWFSSSSSMNDMSESVFFLDSLIDALTERLGNVYLHKIEEVSQLLHNELTTHYPFIMSLTLLKEDAAQWERYATDAKGICIGFNSRTMKEVFQGELFQEVFYEFDITKHKHFENLLEYITKGTTGDFYTSDGGPNLTGLINNIVITANLYKHSSFRAEQEIRLCPLIHYLTGNPRIEFKQVRGVIRKVCIIDIKEKCLKANVNFEDLFNAILIGPRSQQNIFELGDFIKSLGYNKLARKIAASKCPLR